MGVDGDIAVVRAKAADPGAGEVMVAVVDSEGTEVSAEKHRGLWGGSYICASQLSGKVERKASKSPPATAKIKIGNHS